MDFFRNSEFQRTYSENIKIICAALFLFCACFQTARAQDTTPQSNKSATNTSSQANVAPSPSLTPIPFSEVVAQVENASSTLKEIGAGITADPTAETVERNLPVLSDEVNARLEETAQTLEGATSLDKLRSFETDWRTLAKNLPGWKDDLTARAREFEGDLKRLDDLSEKWRKTLAELRKAETPPEILARIEAILQTAASTRRMIETRQARIAALQNRVAEQQNRVDDAINSIKQTRETLVGQLLVQDSPPIWSRNLWVPIGASQGVRDLAATQLDGLSAFAGRNQNKLIIHILVFVLLAAILFYLRRWSRPLVEANSDLKQAAVIFYLPVPTALLLAIIFSSRIYPQTPQILGAIFGAVALVPTIIILKKLVERSLYPLLYALVVFYFIDQLRVITDAVPTISRPLFLAEMLAAFAFFLWLYRARLSVEENQAEEKSGERIAGDKIAGVKKHGLVFRVVRVAAPVVLPFFAIAFLANAFGYVNLSRLIGNAVLRSLYAALILYATARIIDGLIVFGLRFRPLNLLKMVENYAPSIQEKAHKFVNFVAIILWILVTLEFFTLRETVFSRVKAVLTAELSLGSLSISAFDVLLFFALVWVAFLVSRFVRFALEEDVYPRFELSHGIPYAISTMLNYVILLVGFFLAVGAAGFDLTRFTVLVGAFGVGIGFGLQNIFNNFVSGLILLFERPVKIGDEIMIEDETGTVKRIGIRASVIRQWDNSEIIVPNSKLISENVKNWTRSTRKRGVEILVSVAHGTDTRLVTKLLTNVAAAHPLIADKPAPQILLTDFGALTLNFKLRAWATDYNKTTQIKSEMAMAVSQTFAEHNIAVPPVNPNVIIDEKQS